MKDMQIKISIRKKIFQFSYLFFFILGIFEYYNNNCRVIFYYDFGFFSVPRAKRLSV